MDNSALFQSLIDQVDETIGVDSRSDSSIGLWHLLACAHDWCKGHGVDFDGTLADVKEQLAVEQVLVVFAAASVQPDLPRLPLPGGHFHPGDEA